MNNSEPLAVLICDDLSKFFHLNCIPLGRSKIKLITSIEQLVDLPIIMICDSQSDHPLYKDATLMLAKLLASCGGRSAQDMIDLMTRSSGNSSLRMRILTGRQYSLDGELITCSGRKYSAGKIIINEYHEDSDTYEVHINNQNERMMSAIISTAISIGTIRYHEESHDD